MPVPVAFHPAHVDEVHVQGPAAGVVQTLRRVALSQADQLVSLADLGPGRGTVKEPVGEFGHRRSQLGRAALDAVGRLGGVCGEVGRVVLGVGGPAPLGLTDVGLDQAAPVIDVHQLVVRPDLHPLTRRTQSGRHRVQGLVALDVMVLVDLGVAPVRDLVGLAVPRVQGLALLVLENHQWFPVGGAVNAEPRDIAAPALRF